MAKGQLDTVATQIWFDDEIAILTFGLKTGGPQINNLLGRNTDLSSKICMNSNECINKLK